MNNRTNKLINMLTLNPWRKGLVALVAITQLMVSGIVLGEEPEARATVYINQLYVKEANKQGICHVNSYLSRDVEVNEQWPLNCAFDTAVISESEFGSAPLWAYANELGSVHIGMNGEPFGEHISEFPQNYGYNQIQTLLAWEWRFKHQPSITFKEMGFVLNPGFIEHQIYALGGENPAHTPSTSSLFRVGIYYDFEYELEPGKFVTVDMGADTFGSQSRIEGYVNRETDYRYAICETDVCMTDSLNDPIWGFTPEINTPSKVRWESNRFRGKLSTADLVGGQRGAVKYFLRLHGIGSNDLRGSSGLLSDPLDPSDPDAEFDPLNPTNSPVLEADGLVPGDEPAGGVCTNIPALDRFQLNNDGTLHDNFTGLAWQRCPVGFSYLSDLNGEQCIADANAQPMDWTAALQAAADADVGGYNDWQLPNVKQLESIVESCQPATIDYNAFPNTPPDFFWSSTPTRLGHAWAVDFDDGGLQTLPSSELASVRLVRVTGEPLTRPKPRLYAGFGRATETDDNLAALVQLPVTLSRAAASEVTFDFMVTSGTAEAGVDFVAVSGSATIAAGTLATTLDVEINGDTVGEKHEYFLLTLSNPSDNVSMARHVSFGRIIDDDRVYVGVPRVILQLEEGDSPSPETLLVPVVLSQPAKSQVSVDYTTRDASAIAGTHYVPTSGTLNFLAGEQEQFIALTSVGNDALNDDLNLFIDFDNTSGTGFRHGFDTTSIEVRVVDDDGVAHAIGLNDTGPPECGDDCPTLAGLDTGTGRDATADEDGDGIAGFSFSKLDSAGQALANQNALYGSDPWDCARDEVTGLTWEVKTKRDAGAAADDLRHGGSTFSWYSLDSINTNSISGIVNAGVCDGNTDCDTAKYVAHVNSIALCGFSDWRLPEIDELTNIVYDGGAFFGPTLDTDYFPNQEIGSANFVRGTWSATPYIQVDDFIYGYNSRGVARFRAGQPSIGSATRRYVRLVRGNQQR